MAPGHAIRPRPIRRSAWLQAEQRKAQISPSVLTVAAHTMAASGHGAPAGSFVSLGLAAVSADRRPVDPLVAR
jgi:hypothetical protein